MPGLFTLAAADTLKDQIFQGIIKTIELREGGSSDVSQYQNLGPLMEGAELNFAPVVVKSAGGIPVIVAYDMTLKAELLITGTNMRTAVSKLIGNFAECRVTTIDAKKYTFIGPNSSGTGEMDLTSGENVKGDAKTIPIEGAGRITAARFISCYS